MIMSSDKCYGWPAEHMLPVDCKEGQVGCESVDKQGGVICRVVFLRVKVLTHATHAYTNKHIVSCISMDGFFIVSVNGRRSDRLSLSPSNTSLINTTHKSHVRFSSPSDLKSC